GWKNYKETYSSEIQELANNFIHPLIKHKDDKDFSKAAEEKSLTMMSKETAYKFYRNPSELLKLLNIKDESRKVIIKDFEKYVLFNLYKDQQKYDYEYDK
ncbi:hypothetical protein, partial [Flammeovirga yaeyamensis]|uniref:hypothetical protein n=1 Tax=Flammeovirga yaeyamensis TaxID=367791 RepID=UPI00146F4D00